MWWKLYLHIVPLLRCQGGYLGPSDTWSELTDESLALLSKSVTSLTLPPWLRLPAMLCPCWECSVLPLSNLFLLTRPMQGTISHCQVSPRYCIPGNIPWQKKINTGGGGSSESFHSPDGSPGSLYSDHETWAVCRAGMWAWSCGKSCIPPLQESFLILYHSCDITQTGVAIDTVLSRMEPGTTHCQNTTLGNFSIVFSFLCYFNIFYHLEFCEFMFVLHLMKKKTERLFD